MNRDQLSGKVITVLGEIDREELGFAQPHEHVLGDMSVYFVPPHEERMRRLALEPVSIENLYWVRYHTRESLDCQRLLDEEVAIKELMRFKDAGGKSIVELTPKGFHNPIALQRIARTVGIHIIAGTGYYIGLSHGPEVNASTEKEIAEGFVRDILCGFSGDGVRAGIIGEIGCSWPLQESEKKVLRASALAQQYTGAAINIHPSRNENGPLEVIDVLRAAGAELQRVVISHMDRCGYLLDTRLKLLDAGCYIEYDVFGKEGYYPAEAALGDGHLPDMPNDVGRIKQILELIDRGYLRQILISQDTCMKIDLTRWGGPGYAHILENVIPLMRIYGLTEEQINVLTIENPKTMLSIS